MILPTPTTALMTPLTSPSLVLVVSAIMTGYVDQIKLLPFSTNAMALLQIATAFIIIDCKTVRIFACTREQSNK